MEQIFKPDLTNLPWATLLTLACGYAGYYVANVGLREHHKSIDVIFSSLVFGFFAVFAYNIARIIFESSMSAASAAAFATAIVLGGLWSLAGRPLLEASLRRSRVAYVDDLPSAWVALFRAKNAVTQLSVKLKDGTWLKCDDLRKFKSLPDGPCTLGLKGDLLMYVTHAQAPGEPSFEQVDGIVDEQWGAEITFIAADQIVRVDIRRES